MFSFLFIFFIPCAIIYVFYGKVKKVTACVYLWEITALFKFFFYWEHCSLKWYLFYAHPSMTALILCLFLLHYRTTILFMVLMQHLPQKKSSRQQVLLNILGLVCWNVINNLTDCLPSAYDIVIKTVIFAIVCKKYLVLQVKRKFHQWFWVKWILRAQFGICCLYVSIEWRCTEQVKVQRTHQPGNLLPRYKMQWIS